jgi:predicted RecA/RadA family phage recombinase
MQATFVSGDVNMIDYTPGSAVAAGAVVELGTECYVAHTAIAANAVGALAADGGVYDVVKEATTFAIGDPVYWDAGGDPVGGTENSGAANAITGSNIYMGIAIVAAGATDATVRVLRDFGAGTIIS